uniref:Uncharacterized protein n=1 Tax=Tanacetum cinerariifolium TaxID=118510 RepID=A0A6L2M4P8_TANCI|nr:hypothetical protein [Tanacetum cinerariifolium]
MNPVKFALILTTTTTQSRSPDREEDEHWRGPSQGGSVKKSLDKDLFYSFNDGENGGTNEVLNAPIVVSKVDVSLETDEKCVDGLVKDGAMDPIPETIHVSRSQEAETIEAMKAAEEKVESQTSEILPKKLKILRDQFQCSLLLQLMPNLLKNQKSTPQSRLQQIV